MAKDIKAFKTKIYPTKKQKEYFNRCFGIRRFAWNWGVENWNIYKSWISLDKAWNHSEELKENRPYLYEVNSMIKNMAFKDLNESWKKVYKKQGNPPKFKSKKKDSNRFSMNMKDAKSKTKTIMFKHKYIGMTGTRKFGRLRFKSAENLDFLNEKDIRIAEWTISERIGNYYISIIYERTNQSNENISKPQQKIGIDAGMKTMLTSWNGKSFKETNLPNRIKFLEKKLDYLQYKQSKKIYNSYRYNKLKIQINKLYLRISNIKKDFMCKETNYLAKTYSQINIETFDFKGAMKFTKGTRKLHRLSIPMFMSKLEYKCNQYRTNLNVILGKPTTQTCSCCGHRYVKEEKLSIKIEYLFVKPVVTQMVEILMLLKIFIIVYSHTIYK